MGVTIRNFRAEDLSEVKRITLECFDGVSLDQKIEEHFGMLHGHDWRWRKAGQIDADVAASVGGVFVAEEEGKVLGYITGVLDRASGRGWIHNLAIISEARGRGLARQLIEQVLAYFRSEGMSYAVIETMVGNEVGEHLYPSCGFVEVGRHINFAQKL